MFRLNESVNGNTRQFVRVGGQVIGLFYNSMDGAYHLAEYIPYAYPPQRFLCGHRGNFSPTGSTDDQIKSRKCTTCFALAEEMV